MTKSDVVTVYKVPFSKAQLAQLSKEELDRCFHQRSNGHVDVNLLPGITY
jgi:hypothetical protein